MKTILIPVDFSPASENALQYAADLVCNTDVVRIILLKSHYVPIYVGMMSSADFVVVNDEDVEFERQTIGEQLKQLREDMLGKCSIAMNIIAVLSDLPLVRAIHDLIEKEHPDLLLLESDNELVIPITKTSPLPVLIIPSDVKYKKIERALVPCDFTAISRLGLVRDLRSSHQWLHPELIVLNVDPDQTRSQSYEVNRSMVKELLKDYHYSIHYSKCRNKIEGILSFAQQEDVQLIVALPGKHSFFYRLTHNSISEAITRNSRQPVLILK